MPASLTPRRPALAALLSTALALAALLSGVPTPAAWEVVVAPDASPLEQFAAREVRRYTYLRTGEVPEIRTQLRARGGEAIVLGRAARNFLPGRITLPTEAGAFALRTVNEPRRRLLVVVGTDDVATLYGAYRFAEVLGVRFYLHGDVIPDGRVDAKLPDLDESHRPLFALRGIQPFHDFPEGPDWWNEDDYRAVISQLPKLRMNFFALHTYPEGRPNAEPTVWIGPPGDFDANGRVHVAYPSSYMNTLRGNWGYRARPTSSFSHGAADLFYDDAYGASVMQGLCPEPATAEEQGALFDRTGELLRGAFTHAHQLGVKTCVGTETPLVLPRAVADRLRSQGQDPAAPATIQRVYEGMFARIQAAYPIDYYWFWTPEGWTWEGTQDAQIRATTNDLAAAIAAHRAVRPTFQLATCGWVLGPSQDRALFDKVLPPDVAVSCINREVGKTPVEPGFREIRGRGKWAIPWLEDDPALTSPQLWAGRMRRDAADALAYGCDGLLGIHWRTRILGPAVAALGQAAWNQEPWRSDLQQRRARQPAPVQTPGSPTTSPTVPAQVFADTLDFYRDWATAEFGADIAGAAAAIFARIDGRLPRPSDWTDGPGGLKPDPRPWSEVQREYAFVEDLAQLRSSVRGPAQTSRFEWWTETFRYARAMAELNCRWAEVQATLGPATNTPDRAPASPELLFRLRRELVRATGEVYRHLLATVSNPGELGTLANWEQHILPDVFGALDKSLTRAEETPLPDDARLPRTYSGPSRLLVPTAPTSVRHGLAYTINLLVLAEQPARDLAVFTRKLGRSRFERVPVHALARGVFQAGWLPPRRDGEDFEWYAELTDAQGRRVRWPATAPETGHTVVVEPAW